MARCFVNPSPGAPGLVVLTTSGFKRAKAEITAWPDHAPTLLHDAPTLARSAAIAAVRIKDEGDRFGLGLEALGAAYAIAELVRTELARSGVAPAATGADIRAGKYDTQSLTVCCAADADGGRGLAWGARRVGVRCVVFLPETVSASRVAAIEAQGALVRRHGANAAESAHAASTAAVAQGWLLVSDRSWPGFTETPRLFMQAYRVAVDEALDQWRDEAPTHVFIQAGGGGFAAAVAIHLRARLPVMPRVIVVEREGAAPSTLGRDDLCGPEPDLLSSQELERSAAAFLVLGGTASIEGKVALGRLGIASSEPGASGIGGLLTACNDGALREALGLDPASRVLLFNTECEVERMAGHAR